MTEMSVDLSRGEHITHISLDNVCCRLRAINQRTPTLSFAPVPKLRVTVTMFALRVFGIGARNRNTKEGSTLVGKTSAFGQRCS